MICGICKTEGVSIAHVKDCSKGKPFDCDRWPTPEDDRLAMEQVGISPKRELEAGMLVSYCEGVGHDTRYFAIVESKSGFLYAKSWDPDTKKWEYDKGAIVMLRKQEHAVWQEVSLEDAKEFGKAFGCCMVCGRTLTNPDSIEAGIGPICAERF